MTDGQNPQEVDKRIRKDMLQLLQHDQLDQQYAVHYSIVEKQNNSGIMYNQRLLLFVQPDQLGYVNSLDDRIKLPFGRDTCPSFKQHTKISSISSITHDDKNINVKYSQNSKNKSWVFRAENAKLASDWVKLIENAKNKKQEPTQFKKETPKQIINPLLAQQMEQAAQLPKGKASPTGKPRNTPKNVNPNDLPIDHHDNPEPDNPNNPSSLIQQNYQQPEIETEQAKALRLQSILNEELQRIKQQMKHNIPQISAQQLEKVRKNWNYQYYKALKLSSEDNIIEQFKKQCGTAAQDIIDDMGRKPKKHQPIDRQPGRFIFSLNNLTIQICYSTLDEKNYDRPVYDESSIKSATEQFNNLKYISDHCLGEKQSIFVPLCCLLKYKGFHVFVKASLIQQAVAIESSEEQLSAQLDQLSEKTRINKSIYDATDIFKVNYKPYFEAEGISAEDSTVYYIDEASNYLPLALPKTPRMLSLRPEIIQRARFQSKKFRGEPEVRIHKDIQLIEVASTALKDAASQLIGRLECRCQAENEEEYVSNQNQFELLLNSHGLHLEHVRLLMEQATLNITKTTCMSQVASSVACTIIFNSLQEYILQGGTTEAIELVHDLMNTIFDGGPESLMMWSIMNEQAKKDFGMEINRTMVNRHYLAVSVMQQCELDTSDEEWKHLQEMKFQGCVFKGDWKFKVKIKNSIQSAVFKKISRMLSQKDSQIFKAIDQSRFRQREGYAVKRILCHVWDPQNIKTYRPIDIPLIITQFHHLAHNTKNGKDVAHNIDSILTSLSCLYGDYHPLYSRMYDLLSEHFIKSKQFQNARLMAKSSVINSTEIFGQEHVKTAKAYILLSNVMCKEGNHEEAQILRKAQSILRQLDETALLSHVDYLLLCYFHKHGIISEQLQACAVESLKHYEQNNPDTAAKIMLMLDQHYRNVNQMLKKRNIVEKLGRLLQSIKQKQTFQQAYKCVFKSSIKPDETLLEYMDRLAEHQKDRKQIEMYTEGNRILRWSCQKYPDYVKELKQLMSFKKQERDEAIIEKITALTKEEFVEIQEKFDKKVTVLIIIWGWLLMFGKNVLSSDIVSY